MLALLGCLWLFLIAEFLAKLALTPSKETYLQRRKLDVLYVLVPVLTVIAPAPPAALRRVRLSGAHFPHS
jgi:hypothetical protein